MINKYWLFSLIVGIFLYFIIKNIKKTDEPGFMGGFAEGIYAIGLILILIIFLVIWGGIYWW